MPLVLGGDSVISNIVPSCSHCNQELNEWDKNNNPEIYDPLVYDPLNRVRKHLPTEFQNPDKVLPENAN